MRRLMIIWLTTACVACSDVETSQDGIDAIEAPTDRSASNGQSEKVAVSSAASGQPVQEMEEPAADRGLLKPTQRQSSNAPDPTQRDMSEQDNATSDEEDAIDTDGRISVLNCDEANFVWDAPSCMTNSNVGILIRGYRPFVLTATDGQLTYLMQQQTTQSIKILTCNEWYLRKGEMDLRYCVPVEQLPPMMRPRRRN